MPSSRRTHSASPFRRRLGVALLLALASSGCEFGNSFFHMDSNSPSPFFGFDLIPRKATSALTPPPGPSPFVLAGGVGGSQGDFIVPAR